MNYQNDTYHLHIKCLAFLNLILLSGFIRASEKANSTLDDIMYIPVIVHVVYATEDENISLEQINSQLNVLNEDYRSRNTDLIDIDSDFIDSYGDAKIEFVLADKISQLQVDAVIRRSTSITVFKDSDLFNSDMGGSDPIMDEAILNVWVANLAEGLLGFYDQKGVAIDFRSFGTVGTAQTPYHLGRTLTHEIGHFLSLKHLWGNGGCDSDDGIDDTPNQADALSGCSPSNSCGSQDMTQNFMNTSTDECLLFFTEGQIAAMRYYLETNLPSMIHSANDVILSNAVIDDQVSIYPNPSIDGEFTLSSSVEDPLHYSITSFQGVEILNGRMRSEKRLDLRDFSSGIYVVTFTQNNKKLIKKLIIK